MGIPNFWYTSSVPPQKVTHSNLEFGMYHTEVMFYLNALGISVHNKETVFKCLDGYIILFYGSKNQMFKKINLALFL